jgi:hypothetical protein
MTGPRSALSFALLAVGCATLASEAGDENVERPNAMAGPFRALRSDEVASGKAPYVLDKGELGAIHQATVLDLGDGTAPADAALYGVARLASQSGVYRFLAPDARTFAAQPAPATPVLIASEPWEGAELDTPEIVHVGAELLLYYSGDEGIGAARSSDGIAFEKLPGPLLGTSGAGPWEAGTAPRAPTVVEVASDDYRMFYEANGRIGEARSSDGLAWQRASSDPVLQPASDGGAEPPFDGASVGDPEAVVAVGAEGRKVTRVYYTGRAADGTSAIGMAARFGDSGSLTRAVAPAFASSRDPYAPDLVEFGGLVLLYVTERAGSDTSHDYPAIAAGVAPATLSLKVP